MFFDPDNPLERLLAWLSKIHQGLDRLLNSITGWSSPRNAMVLLAVSIICDATEEFLRGQLTAWFILFLVIWVLAIGYALHDLDRWVTAGIDNQAIPKNFDAYMRYSIYMMILVPFDLFFEYRDATSLLQNILITWESWLDLAVIAVAWNLTPPGKSVFAKIADKIAEVQVQAVRSRG